MQRLSVVIILAAIVTVGVAGCGFLDRLEAWKYGVEEGKGEAVQEQQNSEETQTQANATTQDSAAQTPQQNQTVSLAPTSEAAGSLKPSENKVAEAQENNMPQEGIEMKQVSLYYANSEGTGLSAVTAEVPKEGGIARATINQLLAGPSTDSGLVPIIPTGTTLKDINITSDGLCIVDFSSQLVDNYSGDLQNEELMVYSIVNTLTQFPTVESVEIRVDGQQVKTIAGHMDTSEALARNESLIVD